MWIFRRLQSPPGPRLAKQPPRTFSPLSSQQPFREAGSPTQPSLVHVARPLIVRLVQSFCSPRAFAPDFRFCSSPLSSFFCSNHLGRCNPSTLLSFSPPRAQSLPTCPFHFVARLLCRLRVDGVRTGLALLMSSDPLLVNPSITCIGRFWHLVTCDASARDLPCAVCASNAFFPGLRLPPIAMHPGPRTELTKLDVERDKRTGPQLQRCTALSSTRRAPSPLPYFERVPWETVSLGARFPPPFALSSPSCAASDRATPAPGAFRFVRRARVVGRTPRRFLGGARLCLVAGSRGPPRREAPALWHPMPSVCTWCPASDSAGATRPLLVVRSLSAYAYPPPARARPVPRSRRQRGGQAVWASLAASFATCAVFGSDACSLDRGGARTAGRGLPGAGRPGRTRPPARVLSVRLVRGSPPPSPPDARLPLVAAPSPTGRRVPRLGRAGIVVARAPVFVFGLRDRRCAVPGVPIGCVSPDPPWPARGLPGGEVGRAGRGRPGPRKRPGGGRVAGAGSARPAGSRAVPPQAGRFGAVWSGSVVLRWQVFLGFGAERATPARWAESGGGRGASEVGRWGGGGGGGEAKGKGARAVLTSWPSERGLRTEPPPGGGMGQRGIDEEGSVRLGVGERRTAQGGRSASRGNRRAEGLRCAERFGAHGWWGFLLCGLLRQLRLSTATPLFRCVGVWTVLVFRLSTRRLVWRFVSMRRRPLLACLLFARRRTLARTSRR